MFSANERYNLRILRPRSPDELDGILSALGADPRGREIMAPKGWFLLLAAEGLSHRAAVILKQEMLAKGGEAAVPRRVYEGNGEAGALLMGTAAQYEAVCRTLAEEPFGLAALGKEIRAVLHRSAAPPAPIRIGGRMFDWGRRTYVMGILNATPDSFSGDGLRRADDPPAEAVARAREMAAAGADILDIGAESTRPGADPVTAEEDLDRLLPILRAVAGSVEIPVSVDTSKAAVAAAALAGGASCLNDIWGLQRDPEIAGAAARAGVPVIVMHNQEGTEYKEIMGDMTRFLRRSMAAAEAAGIPADRVIVDPGVGFGKTRRQNLEVLNRLGELRALGRPILLGTSRKSVIGLTLDLPVDERTYGTAATVALGIAAGADIVRVHDVREMVQVARMADAVVRGDDR